MKQDLAIPIDVRQKDCTGPLDLKAICVWMAFGFMLDADTFFEREKWNRPDIEPWYYRPDDISFDEAVKRYTKVFEQTIEKQVGNKKVLLALSGGIDSRTLAVGLSNLGVKPYSYSYKFQNSFDETQYGEKLAKIAGWEFKEYIIPSGYLLDRVDEFGEINQCYSEFTHARQAAVASEIALHGDVFLLGHWGDVLFDDMNVPDSLSEKELVSVIIKKMSKRGGFELGSDLWAAWGIEGEFMEYLNSRVSALLADIKIANVNARVRAFKSMYWAVRWTNTNLQFFSHYKPIAEPYYDSSICKLVCETPEKYLKDRLIQIEYIKRSKPAMAKVAWQTTHPYNLNNYHKYHTWADFPRRAIVKSAGLVNEKLLRKKLVTRNWEIQFLGKENDEKLRQRLFGEFLTRYVPEEIINKYYGGFKDINAVQYSHPLSMLLTFSVFIKRLKKLKQDQ